MTEEGMIEALDLIHDEAQKLLTLELPENVEQGLERILALARYKFAVTTKSEQNQSGGPNAGN
jgi:hypothetical protein